MHRDFIEQPSSRKLAKESVDKQATFSLRKT